MADENPNKPTSVRFSPADVSDLEELVTKGVFTHFSDAARAVVRRGILHMIMIV